MVCAVQTRSDFVIFNKMNKYLRYRIYMSVCRLPSKISFLNSGLIRYTTFSGTHLPVSRITMTTPLRPGKKIFIWCFRFGHRYLFFIHLLREATVMNILLVFRTGDEYLSHFCDRPTQGSETVQFMIMRHQRALQQPSPWKAKAKALGCAPV